MVSHLFYYQLALFVLVWLFVMLHLTWSKPGVTIPSMPAKPRRRRTSELKPIAGLTVVYLSPADKYHRLTHRPSQGQKGLDERAIMTSPWSSHPW